MCLGRAVCDQEVCGKREKRGRCLKKGQREIRVVY